MKRSTDYEFIGKPQEDDRGGRQRRVKVQLADDHTMFREGLAGILASSYGDRVQVVGKTDTGDEVVELARKGKPDVIIMQVDRALKKARDTLQRIREGSSSLPKVIILTMFEDPHLLREILHLGADAYVHKSASTEELFAAVLGATLDTQGEPALVAMPRGALDRADEHGWSKDGWSKDGSGRALSEREFEILLLVARGMTNREIASRLGIAEGTVNRHLANLYPKMGVASRREAVRLALEHEWFTIPEIEVSSVVEEV